MALTDSTVSNGAVGPGAVMLVTNPAGPVPIDDVVEVTIEDPATGYLLCFGAVRCDGALTTGVLLGRSALVVPVPAGIAGLARGALVDVRMTWRHANGTLVDTLNVLGVYVWDPTSYLWSLVVAQGNSLLAAIRAAVYKTFS